MSRLSEVLGVPEGVKFSRENDDAIYAIDGNTITTFLDDKIFIQLDLTEAVTFYDLLHNTKQIKILPERHALTDQQITAIKGRIAEGTPWASRDKNGARAFFFPAPPINVNGKFKTDNYNWTYSLEDNLYDFITYENSPVYLPDLIEGSEGA